jgi:hypothetical protein
MTNQLPRLKYNKKWYFIDKRVGQIRNVNNPSDFIDFQDLPEEVILAISTL